MIKTVSAIILLLLLLHIYVISTIHRKDVKFDALKKHPDIYECHISVQVCPEHFDVDMSRDSVCARLQFGAFLNVLFTEFVNICVVMWHVS